MTMLTYAVEGGNGDGTIISDVVKMSSCYGDDISLFFDPNGHEYPFKGENSQFKLKLKAK